MQQYLRSGRIDEGTELARRLFRDVGLVFPETLAQTLVSYGWNRTVLRFSPYRYEDGQAHQSPELTHERLETLDATFREVTIVDLMRGAALRAQFRRYAQAAGDAPRVMHSLAWDAWNAAMTSRTPKPAMRLLEQVEALANQLGTPYAMATVMSARAGCALVLRRLGEVVAPATEAERVFREHCTGSYWEQNLTTTYRYAAIEHVGGFRTILQETPSRAREASDKDDRFATAFLTLFVTFSHLVNDQLQEAQDFLAEQRAQLTEPYGAFHLWAAIRTAHTLLYAGEGKAALLHMEHEMKRFEASAAARSRYYATAMQSLIARCCLAASKESPGEKKALIQRAERYAATIAQESQPYAVAIASMLRADAAHKRGDDEQGTSCCSTAFGRGLSIRPRCWSSMPSVASACCSAARTARRGSRSPTRGSGKKACATRRAGRASGSTWIGEPLVLGQH